MKAAATKKKIVAKGKEITNLVEIDRCSFSWRRLLFMFPKYLIQLEFSCALTMQFEILILIYD